MIASGVDVQMDTVALITDSSACLPKARIPVRIVPVVIHLPGEDLRGDARDVAGRVYDALRRHEPVKSSAPTAVEYIEAIENSDAESVVVITPATEFTTMYRNASVAADLTGRDVTVVDSRTAAAAQGLVVEQAASALVAGGSAMEAVRVAEEAAGRVELVAALDGLDYLRRSGRVPPAAVGLARHLGVRPVFRLHGGLVERLGVPRSRQSALDRVTREAERRGVHEAGRRVVFHAADPDRASLLQRRLGVSQVTEFSPSMGIHTGPGVVGVAWLGPEGGARLG
jgi:DegV family protein with EDD domain